MINHNIQNALNSLDTDAEAVAVAMQQSLDKDR